jgi:hypothetical protein
MRWAKIAGGRKILPGDAANTSTFRQMATDENVGNREKHWFTAVHANVNKCECAPRI